MKSSGIMNGLGLSYVHSHGWSEQQSNPRLVQKMCQKRTAGGGSCSREIDCNLLSARIETQCLLFLLGVFLTVEGVVGPGYGRTLGKFFSPRVDFRLDLHARSSCQGVLLA